MIFQINPEDYFFIIFLITILIIRFFLYFKPIPSPTIKGCRLHHYIYGILILLISLIVNNLTLFSIGLGLFIDELTFLLIKGRNHKDNYSSISLIGTLLFIILIFISKEYILKLFGF